MHDHKSINRKTRYMSRGFEALCKYLGTERAKQECLERPALLALGESLAKELQRSEHELGSVEAVRDEFEDILERSGLKGRFANEEKARPRNGICWTPSRKKLKKFYVQQKSSDATRPTATQESTNAMSAAEAFSP